MATRICDQCHEPFAQLEQVMQSSGRNLHIHCHVCVECFRPFPNERFYAYDERNYCEEDYRELFGPKCGHCGEFIVGKCISALDAKWHPEHFTCSVCGTSLAGTAFVKKDGRPWCKPCSNVQKPADTAMCAKCRKPLDGEFIVLQNQKMHPYHFSCHTCKATLSMSCKEYEGKLYCHQDYERARQSVCAACRKPIEGRATTALGKQWHPEHFVCVKCEQPFSGATFFEYKGQAYCAKDYRSLLTDRCFTCNNSVKGEVVNCMNKMWCMRHFFCYGCGLPMSRMDMKFIECDNRPMCRKCYDCIPSDSRKNIKKYEDLEKKMQENLKKANK
ncbi:LIMS2 protein [Capsaspora owczarzaki ATCC 30864]|uniref:LIMS2 protein n=1 Tax=Capsaspora owczarzaki (strain ATCC 30864) TaxID=595528 RepID=A0A0D2UDW0_CAPO3|nr:LIMS2 protein [Capsaspora owczarzaki ATCC 30864]KJE93271.1 LIMS2 protein [Capsaspora owczarzaki ATCC 30864]|eukprot:XP_004347908.1 LIMS2 protein [Capsaspora owczarzaki ATCC 30864]